MNHRSWRVALALLTLWALTACGKDGAEPVTAGEDGAEPVSAGEAPGSVTLPLAVSKVAVDDDGRAWLTTVGSGQLTVRMLEDEDEVPSVELEGSADAAGYGHSIFPFEDGVAVAHILCSDQPCREARLALDVLTVDGAEITADRRWTTTPFNSASAAQVISADRGGGSPVLFAGGRIYWFEADGQVEESQLLVDEGNPCVVEGRVLAIVPETTNEAFEGPFGDPEYGPEERVFITELIPGGGKLDLPDSNIAYDREAGFGPRCGSAGLEIAKTDQLALQVWDVSSSRWTDPTEREPLEWRFPDVQAGPHGLVGVIGDSIVRVDSVTGDMLGQVPISDEMLSLLEAQPNRLGGEVAINLSGTAGVVCVANGNDGSTQGGQCALQGL
jgi:hypothetical protein